MYGRTRTVHDLLQRMCKVLFIDNRVRVHEFFLSFCLFILKTSGSVDCRSKNFVRVDQLCDQIFSTKTTSDLILSQSRDTVD